MEDESTALLPAPAPAAKPAPAPTPTPAQREDFARENSRKGYVYMLFSTCCFAAVTLLLHAAETRLHMAASAALLLRSGALLLFSPPLFLALPRAREHARRTAALPPRVWKWVALRAVTGATGLALHTASLKYVPAGDATAIFLTIPTFTMLASWLLIGETVPPVTRGAALASLVGAALVGMPDGAGRDGEEAVPVAQRVAGSLCALGAAVVTSASYTVVRKLGTSVHFLTTVFALGAVAFALSLAIGGAAALSDSLRRTGASGDGWAGVLLVVASGACALGVQTALAKALQLSKAGPAVLMRNLDIPVVYVASAVLFGEIPSLLRVGGATLLVVSAVVMAVQKVH